MTGIERKILHARNKAKVFYCILIFFSDFLSTNLSKLPNVLVQVAKTGFRELRSAVRSAQKQKQGVSLAFLCLLLSWVVSRSIFLGGGVAAS